jgi:hypothetical protein
MSNQKQQQKKKAVNQQSNVNKSMSKPSQTTVIIRSPKTKDRVITGRGDYNTAKKKVMKTGKTLAKMNSKENFSWWDLGAKLLPLALKGGAMLMGLGDYTVNSNSLVAQATDGVNGIANVPDIVNSKHTNIIRHREYVSKVYGATGDFTLISHNLNPANDALFPWLANISHNYTRYRWRGLVFEYVALSADYAANTALGYVAMATNYDAVEPAFTDKISMMNYMYANERKPSKDFMHAIECAPSQNTVTEFYVRSTASQPTGTDIRLYDIGKFQLAVGGNPSANGYLGDLWVTYEIEFFQERMPGIIGSHLESAFFSASNNVGSAIPFGDNGTLDSQNTMRLFVGADHFNILSNQAKYVEATVQWASGTAVVIAFPTVTLTNCTATYYNGSTVGWGCSSGVTSGRLMWSAFLTITNPETVASVAFGTAGTIPSTSATVNLNVNQISKFSFMALSGSLKTNKFQSTRVLDQQTLEELDNLSIVNKKNRLEVEVLSDVLTPEPASKDLYKLIQLKKRFKYDESQKHSYKEMKDEIDKIYRTRMSIEDYNQLCRYRMEKSALSAKRRTEIDEERLLDIKVAMSVLKRSVF